MELKFESPLWNQCVDELRASLYKAKLELIVDLRKIQEGRKIKRGKKRRRN